MKKSIFDERAAEWDTPHRKALAKAVADAIIRNVDLTSSMRVMDFGAGTGLVTFEICGRVKTVTAIDSSVQMLEVLRNKKESMGISNVLAENLDLDSVVTRFDLIISSMTMHHVADVNGLFRRFHGLLETGGRIALADLDSEKGDFHSNNEGVEHFGFDRNALIDECESAGFGSVSVDDAYRMKKTSSDGTEKEYGVFLLTARKI